MRKDREKHPSKRKKRSALRKLQVPKKGKWRCKSIQNAGYAEKIRTDLR